MQATIDAAALKPFTKALTCIARYGDELTLHATSQDLALSATNSSKSAYARFKYDRTFFQKYALDQQAEDEEVTGQLLVKSLLSILRHRAVDKTVEKCELSIVDGGTGEDDDERDSLESKLVVVLHCKHGVIKTHRLLLSTPNSLMAPGAPDASTESFLTVGPRAIKDMVEHFPTARGNKSDSQLIWNFGESEVEVKTLESSLDSKGKGKSQLATELTISAEEFDVYNLYAAPTVIAFHLGEFNATIAFTDAISVTMDLRFTDPAAPLFIDVESDGLQALFVISTSQVHNAGNTAPQVILKNKKKRAREEDSGSQDATWATPRPKKPMKAAQPTPSVNGGDRTASHPNRSQVGGMSPLPDESESVRDMSMGPPPFIPPPSIHQTQARRPSSNHRPHTPPPPSSFMPRPNAEPLFLPSSSQQSNKAFEDLHLEEMTAEELETFLDPDADLEEEVMMDTRFSQNNAEPDAMVVDSDDISIEATQTRQLDDSKAFQPLFDD